MAGAYLVAYFRLMSEGPAQKHPVFQKVEIAAVPAANLPQKEGEIFSLEMLSIMSETFEQAKDALMARITFDPKWKWVLPHLGPKRSDKDQSAQNWDNPFRDAEWTFPKPGDSKLA